MLTQGRVGELKWYLFVLNNTNCLSWLQVLKMQRQSLKATIVSLPLNFSSFSLKLGNLRVHRLTLTSDSDSVRVGWANLWFKMRAGVILLNTGDGLAPGTLETQVTGKGPVLRLCRSQLPGRLFSNHTHLAPSISTHSALGNHFCLKYIFFLLVCRWSRKFENQLFFKKKEKFNFRQSSGWGLSEDAFVSLWSVWEKESEDW